MIKKKKSVIKEVNVALLNKWITESGPNGGAKLSVYANVSESLIRSLKRGIAPKKDSTKYRIAKTIGVKIVDLFPEHITYA
jgi:hypothetical protein